MSDDRATLVMSTFRLDRRGLSRGGGRVRFTGEPDEPGDVPNEVLLAANLDADLGHPEVITVSVLPRDVLNEEDPRAE